MRAQICFFVSIVFSFVAWGVVTGSLILPELRRRGRNEALRLLLMFHSFRFVGLAFLVPGVVSPDLPAVFAEGAAYGDIVAAALALLTLALLPGRLGVVAKAGFAAVHFGRNWHKTSAGDDWMMSGYIARSR